MELKSQINKAEQEKDIKTLEEIQENAEVGFEGEIAGLAKAALDRLHGKIEDAEKTPDHVVEKLGEEKLEEVTAEVDKEIEALQEKTEREIEGVVGGIIDSVEEKKQEIDQKINNIGFSAVEKARQIKEIQDQIYSIQNSIKEKEEILHNKYISKINPLREKIASFDSIINILNNKENSQRIHEEFEKNREKIYSSKIEPQFNEFFKNALLKLKSFTPDHLAHTYREMILKLTNSEEEANGIYRLTLSIFDALEPYKQNTNVRVEMDRGLYILDYLIEGEKFLSNNLLQQNLNDHLQSNYKHSNFHPDTYQDLFTFLYTIKNAAKLAKSVESSYNKTVFSRNLSMPDDIYSSVLSSDNSIPQNVREAMKTNNSIISKLHLEISDAEKESQKEFDTLYQNNYEEYEKMTKLLNKERGLKY